LHLEDVAARNLHSANLTTRAWFLFTLITRAGHRGIHADHRLIGNLERPAGRLPGHRDPSEQLVNGTEILDPTPIVGISNAAGELKHDSGVEPFTLATNDDTATSPVWSTSAFVIEGDNAPISERRVAGRGLLDPLTHSAVLPAVDALAVARGTSARG
jgi:hypothetical protein